MTTISATKARGSLYSLIDEANTSHEPIQITGKRGNAVLISEDDWRAIQETLYLQSIPGVVESILAARAEGLEQGPGSWSGELRHHLLQTGAKRRRQTQQAPPPSAGPSPAGTDPKGPLRHAPAL